MLIRLLFMSLELNCSNCSCLSVFDHFQKTYSLGYVWLTCISNLNSEEVTNIYNICVAFPKANADAQSEMAAANDVHTPHSLLAELRTFVEGRGFPEIRSFGNNVGSIFVLPLKNRPRSAHVELCCGSNPSKHQSKQNINNKINFYTAMWW